MKSEQTSRLLPHFYERLEKLAEISNGGRATKTLISEYRLRVAVFELVQRTWREMPQDSLDADAAFYYWQSVARDLVTIDQYLFGPLPKVRPVDLEWALMLARRLSGRSSTLRVSVRYYLDLKPQVSWTQIARLHGIAVENIPENKKTLSKEVRKLRSFINKLSSEVFDLVEILENLELPPSTR